MKFSGQPLARWLDDNRKMILEAPISFTDKRGKLWEAPINTELNGATIPRVLWSLLGSPYIGLYRRASVIHDFHVGEGSNPDVTYSERRKADKMFYYACRTDGCRWRFAVLLYIGVSIGSWRSRKYKNEKYSELDKSLRFRPLKMDKLMLEKYEEIESQFYLNKSIQEDDFENLEKFVDSLILNT